MNKTDLGRRVSERLTEVGKDLDQVAKDAAMNKDFLTHIENEVCVLTMGQLTRLAEALETTAPELLGFDPVSTSSSPFPGLDGVTDPVQSFESTIMDRDECVKLLQSQQVGRLGLLTSDGPMIFPVNYVIDGEVIVFRTDPGTKLAEAPMSRVAFEIDRVDPGPAEPWSVVVKGYAVDVTHGIGQAADQFRNSTLSSWIRGDKNHWIAVMPKEITGRRLRRSPAEPPASSRPQ